MNKTANLCCLATLAACATSDPTAVKAGKWLTTTEIEYFETPGRPAAAVEQMNEATKSSAEICLNKEGAAAPNADTLAPKGGRCSSSQFEIKDGNLAAKLSCRVGDAKLDVVVDGTIRPELYTIRSTVISTTPGMGETKMVTKVESKRIGDC